MTPEERESLAAALGSAHRERSPSGEIRWHRAFFDLPEEDREAAFDDAAALRVIEAGMDEEGLSSTARAVLARLP